MKESTSQANLIYNHNKQNSLVAHPKTKKLAKIEEKNKALNNLSVDKIDNTFVEINQTKERHTLGSFVRSIRLEV